MTAPLAEERLTRILDLLARQGTVRTAALTQHLGISGATARRDLDLLAQRGLIRKVHGGAALASQDQRYSDRQQAEQGAKARLAALVPGLLQPGQTVYLDAGTTALQVAQALRRTPALTRTLRVVTHAIDVASELNGECTLYVVGGEVYGSTYSVTGPDALATVQRYSYDVFLVGCTSIDPGRGLTNSNLVEAQQKAAVMGRSGQSLLIADHSKWGHAGFATFAGLGDVAAWITDCAPPEAREAFGAAGTRIIEAASAAQQVPAAAP